MLHTTSSAARLLTSRTAECSPRCCSASARLFASHIPHCNLPRRPLGRSKRETSSSRRRRRALQCAAAEKSYYELLGVTTEADVPTIKRAFKKKALELHPDVNQAEDAKERFMECKVAYQTLVDKDQRRQYDRSRSGDTGSFDWNPFNRGPASAQPRPGRESEPFYGFGEFWKDLEKDLADRRQRRGGQPQSLLAELAELGEEFVEFLEQELVGLKGKAEAASAAARKQYQQTSSSAQSRKAGRGSGAEDAVKKAQKDAERTVLSAEEQRQRSEEEVEEMLRSLKQDLGSNSGGR